MNDFMKTVITILVGLFALLVFNILNNTNESKINNNNVIDSCIINKTK